VRRTTAVAPIKAVVVAGAAGGLPSGQLCRSHYPHWPTQLPSAALSVSPIQTLPTGQSSGTASPAPPGHSRSPGARQSLGIGFGIGPGRAEVTRYRCHRKPTAIPPWHSRLHQPVSSPGNAIERTIFIRHHNLIAVNRSTLATMVLSDGRRVLSSTTLPAPVSPGSRDPVCIIALGRHDGAGYRSHQMPGAPDPRPAHSPGNAVIAVATSVSSWIPGPDPPAKDSSPSSKIRGRPHVIGATAGMV